MNLKIKTMNSQYILNGEGLFKGEDLIIPRKSMTFVGHTEEKHGQNNFPFHGLPNKPRQCLYIEYVTEGQGIRKYIRTSRIVELEESELTNVSDDIDSDRSEA